MLHELLKTEVYWSFSATQGGSNGPVVLTSTGDKMAFTAVAPIRLLKWGFLINDTAVAQTSSAMQLGLYKTLAASAGGGSAGGTQVDTLTTVASEAFALGTGAYRDPYVASTSAQTPASEVSSGGPLGSSATNNLIYSGQQQLQLVVGDQFWVKVITASDNTGKGVCWLEYVLLPITKPSSYGFGATSPDGVVAGSVSLTDNYTHFAS